jgi:hypothetical protein
MQLPQAHEFLLLSGISHNVELAEKKKKLLEANRAAARALLSSISTVSYITVRKNVSTE